MVCLIICTGCVKKTVKHKQSVMHYQDVSRFSLLENVALPFASTIEYYQGQKNIEAGNKADIFYVYFDNCSIDFLVDYYKNTMEQYGWILNQEFNASDAVILHFSSVSRTCFVYIYKQEFSDNSTEKVMLCVAKE